MSPHISRDGSPQSWTPTDAQLIDQLDAFAFGDDYPDFNNEYNYLTEGETAQ